MAFQYSYRDWGHNSLFFHMFWIWNYTVRRNGKKDQWFVERLSFDKNYYDGICRIHGNGLPWSVSLSSSDIEFAVLLKDEERDQESNLSVYATKNAGNSADFMKGDFMRVNIEKYVNDSCRDISEMTFSSLDMFGDWIFQQVMEQDFRDPYMGFSILSFPFRDVPLPIMFRTGGSSYMIHLIRDARGVIFSDGKYTGGLKYWTPEVKAWMKYCHERQYRHDLHSVHDESEQSGEIGEATQRRVLFHLAVDVDGDGREVIVHSFESEHKTDCESLKAFADAVMEYLGKSDTFNYADYSEISNKIPDDIFRRHGLYSCSSNRDQIVVVNGYDRL